MMRVEVKSITAVPKRKLQKPLHKHLEFSQWRTTVISLLSFQGFYASQWAGFTLQAQRLLHTGVATWRGLWRLEREQPER